MNSTLIIAIVFVIVFQSIMLTAVGVWSYNMGIRVTKDSKKTPPALSLRKVSLVRPHLMDPVLPRGEGKVDGTRNLSSKLRPKGR